MKNSFFVFTAVDFIVLTAVCIGLITWAISRSMRSASYASDKGHWAFLAVAVFWMALLSIVSLTGFFSNFSTLPPRLIVAVIVPMLLIVYFTVSGKFDKVLKLIPPAWVMYLQVFRLPVEILLWMLFAQQLLPAQMTFEGRNWDILVGLTALPAAYWCFGQSKFRTGMAISWNIAGLALLTNIVTIAVLSMPTPFRVFMEEPANTIVATFPFVLLPGVLVPLAFSLHLLSLRQILLFKKGGISTRLHKDLAMM